MKLHLSCQWAEITQLLCWTLAYVEMHYRWWPLPSRYFRREPEILADAPRRVNPGKPLPLLLLIKDAHRYPIFLEKVVIQLETGQERQDRELTIAQRIDQHWWHRTLALDHPGTSRGCIVRVTFHYTVRGQQRSCTSHNLPSLEPEPLHVYLAAEPLPGKDVLWGDIHQHTALTEDMVEFGAPLEATQDAAAAAGLDFICVIDHSYDLDDAPGSWLRPDPALTKWHTSRKHITDLNRREHTAVLVPGEEVTVRNIRGRNVHALILGHPDYLPGSGDSGERPFRTKSELDVATLVAQLSPESLAIAAHPYQTVKALQRLVIRRGVWEQQDITTTGIAGMQVLNGRIDAGFRRGVEEWVRLLLRGHRIYIYAGSDAHGDFNIHRQIRMPFLTLGERRTNIAGVCRTGVLQAEPGDATSILTGLKAGRCIISTGPYMNMTIQAGDQTGAMGATIRGRRVQVLVEMHSSEEYGPPAHFRLLRGVIGHEQEEVVQEGVIDKGQYRLEWQSGFKPELGTCYFRAEAETAPPEQTGMGEGFTALAMTNPIWVSSP